MFPEPPKPPLPPPPLPPSFLISNLNATKQIVYNKFLQYYIFKYANRDLYKTCSKIDLDNLNYLKSDHSNNNINKFFISNNNSFSSSSSKWNDFLKQIYSEPTRYIQNNFLLIPFLFFIICFILIVLAIFIYK